MESSVEMIALLQDSSLDCFLILQMGFGVCSQKALFIAPYTLIDTEDLPTPYVSSNFFYFFLPPLNISTQMVGD